MDMNRSTIASDGHPKLFIFDNVEENFNKMEEAVEKAKRVAFNDGSSSDEFNEQEWTNICLCSLSLSNANLSANRFSLLMAIFWLVLRDCVEAKVIPGLTEKVDPQPLLIEFVQLWEKYKQLVDLLSNIFEPHFDTYQRTMGKSFKDSAYDYFYDEVFEEMHFQIITAALSLIKHERFGNEIPPNLLRDTYGIYAESATIVSDWFDDLERCLMDDAIEYYSELSSRWLMKDSIHVYLHKVDRVLELETGRMGAYLPPPRVQIQIEAVRQTLVNDNALAMIPLIFNF